MRLAPATFAALAVPNFRRYFTGQAASLAGTWMQRVAQAWLVLELTGSGTALGLVAAAQFLPVTLLAPYGGVLADRLSKRHMLFATQTTLSLVSLTLGVLTVTGVVRLWMVVVLAVLMGVASAADNPTRQAFMMEMVGRDELRNAVSLNTVLVNAARLVGPALAGLLIAISGTGVCFLVDATSYLALLAALRRMDSSALHPTPPMERARGQVREGVRYVARTPALAVPLVMLALVGTLAFEFSVVLPLVAHTTFHGGPGAYALLTAAMGGGAVVGGLVAASRSRTGLGPLSWAAALFAGALALVVVSPTLTAATAAMALVGAASVTFLSIGNATIQLAADPEFRGRTMAFWSVAFLGSTPVGGPIIGVISEHLSPRAGLATGMVACLVAAGIGVALGPRARRRAAARPVPPATSTPAAR